MRLGVFKNQIHNLALDLKSGVINWDAFDTRLTTIIEKYKITDKEGGINGKKD